MPLFFFSFAVLLALPVAWPQVDLLLSGLFYRAGEGFPFADNLGMKALHLSAYYGARVLGLAFVGLAFAAWVRSYLRGKRGYDSSKPWVFLFLALLIGPGLVANVGFKDHWGRARPREVVEFGGKDTFSPALAFRFEKARSNGSFVSGDGAFGFFLPAFGYVAPSRFKRKAFWGGMAGGVVFGFVRVAMGAHFFSDVVYAAFFMLVSVAGVHAAMFGRQGTSACWNAFFKRPPLA